MNLIAPKTPALERALRREDDLMLELAIDIAYQAFTEPTDDHVDGVYARLQFGAQRGESPALAASVH
ncbi:hypothetical protein H0A71_06000 [Alcaligenaceae bacterium]|nr:hypothetical protein [Alcaligenaceae bacterium]